MILYLDSDTIYLVAPKLKSRIKEFFYLGNKYTLLLLYDLKINEKVYIDCKLL